MWPGNASATLTDKSKANGMLRCLTPLGQFVVSLLKSK